MTDAERIAQLEEENAKLKSKLAEFDVQVKAARIDPIPPEKVVEDFDLPDDCKGSDISKLKQLIYMLVFPETTYVEGRSSATRIRLANMSDSQYEFYCNILNLIYENLLVARKTARDLNLNVWDLNSPNVTRGIANNIVKSKRFKHPYIHKGETSPRKGE